MPSKNSRSGVVLLAFVLFHSRYQKYRITESKIRNSVTGIDGSIFFSAAVSINWSTSLELHPHLTFPKLSPISFSYFQFIMKISQKIEQSAKEDKIWWSFEYFPPRTAQVPILMLAIPLI